jgi:hypothetical protein
MRRLLVSVALCAALLVMLPGCGKDDNPSNSNNNNNGTSGDLKITGWAPQLPYPGDIVTITGTGFSDDDTANHVQLGGYMNFLKNIEVISATTTELKVRLPGDSVYAPREWHDLFRIVIGNKTYTHDKFMNVHSALRITRVTTFAGPQYVGIIPDKQVVLEMTGFNPSEGGSFSVPGAHNGGLTIDSVEYDTYTQYGKVRCSVPRNLMMEAPVPWQTWLNDSQNVRMPVVVSSNGRTYSNTTFVYFLPQTRIDSVRPTDITLEQLNSISSSGGQLFITVYGRNLYGFVHGTCIPTQVIENYTDKFPVQIGGLNWAVPKRGSYPIYLQSRNTGDTASVVGGATIGTIYIN